ncbi:MAG: hypothetical protein K9L61_05155 [Candidatus Omnitrophica bacterium]|nr:hypothetical protein [Candidatus Omnitrophota bacterium]
MAQRSKTNSNHETLALVLLVSGLTGFFLWLWQITYIPKHLVGWLNFAFSIFDFYLAYKFFKIKFKAKKLLFLRIFLGLFGWFIVFYFLETQYGLIWAKITFLLSLAILSLDKIKKPIIIALAALIILFANAYFTASYISSKQKLLINLKEYGKGRFTSKDYNYKFTTPSNWKIIKREDFAKIKEKFLKTEAKAALISKNGESFCLIIPNKLSRFMRVYNLNKIKKALVKSLKIRGTVKINKVDSFINKNKGFQIQYTDIIEGNRQEYIIIYLNMGDFGLKFIGWALGNNQEKMYAEIKEMAKNIAIDNK